MVQKYRKEDNDDRKNSSRKSVKVVKTVLEAVLKLMPTQHQADSISARDAI